MMAVRDATYDQSMGTQSHRISISRYLGSVDADRRLGGQILSDLMNGKTRYFTSAIGDPLTRVSVWRSNAPGSRIMMIKGLQSAIANSCNLMNIVSAMENQVRTHSAATKDLQPALTLSLNQMRTFVNTYGSLVPVSFAVELMVKLLDAMIVGPSTGLGGDSKREYDEAKKSGSLMTATARYFEGLAVTHRDPTAKSQLNRERFYKDEQSFLELQEDFLKLYTSAQPALPEYHQLVLEMQTWFLERNSNYHKPEFRDPVRTSIMEYLGICACARFFEHKEMAMNKFGANPAGLGRERSHPSSDSARRVNSVEAMAKLEQQVATLQHNFRAGGGAPDGTSPPSYGLRSGKPTVPDGLVGATRHRVAAYQRSPSPTPSLAFSSGDQDMPTFIGDDGGVYWKGVGSPEAPLSDVIRATESLYNIKISLEHLNCPKHIPTDEFLNTLEVRGHLLNAVYDGGKCDEKTLRGLAYVSPAAPYGGFQEPAQPQYCNDKVVMQKRLDGAMQWAKKACSGCAFCPPWDTNNGASPPFLTAALFRNEVGADHKPPAASQFKKCDRNVP